ncbi:MAG: hypothetical protein M3443_17815, partial [Actinomycetota bacterium]|nr:hypothetical protein [Actinomycetota bacterium]
MTQQAAIPAISERSPAMLPLPNAFAFVIAGISVCATSLIPLALVVGDRTLTELVAGYYLHSLVLFTV